MKPAPCRFRALDPPCVATSRRRLIHSRRDSSERQGHGDSAWPARNRPHGRSDCSACIAWSTSCRRARTADADADRLRHDQPCRIGAAASSRSRRYERRRSTSDPYPAAAAQPRHHGRRPARTCGRAAKACASRSSIRASTRRHPDLAGRIVEAGELRRRQPATRCAIVMAQPSQASSRRSKTTARESSASRRPRDCMRCAPVGRRRRTIASAVCSTLTLAKALAAAIEARIDIVNLSLDRSGRSAARRGWSKSACDAASCSSARRRRNDDRRIVPDRHPRRDRRRCCGRQGVGRFSAVRSGAAKC